MKFTYCGDAREYPNLPYPASSPVVGESYELAEAPDGRWRPVLDDDPPPNGSLDQPKDEPDGSSFFVAPEPIPGAPEFAEEA